MKQELHVKPSVDASQTWRDVAGAAILDEPAEGEVGLDFARHDVEEGSG